MVDRSVHLAMRRSRLPRPRQRHRQPDPLREALLITLPVFVVVIALMGFSIHRDYHALRQSQAFRSAATAGGW
jgi:hypothetical protein